MRAGTRAAGALIAAVLCILSGDYYCLSSADAAQRVVVDVRVSQEDGLISTVFRAPSGAKVIAFLPLNFQTDESEIGGIVERQLPPVAPNAVMDPDQLAEATDEVSGVVVIQPDKCPPSQCPPESPSFTCPPPPNRKVKVTYRPPHGPPCTTEVNCPPCPPPAAWTAAGCGIPQLTNCGGNAHVSMACPKGDTNHGSMAVDGQPCTLRAWSAEGCVFRLPPSSECAPGPHSVVVRRGDKVAVGKIYAAKVQMSCTPSHLKQGQPCQVTTTVTCPGIKDVKGGVLIIKNHNQAVLQMADQVIPINSL